MEANPSLLETNNFEIELDVHESKPWIIIIASPVDITKTRLYKYTENFTTKKGKFSDKSSDIFHISAQNIDCGYSLEPPRRGGSNGYPQSMFLSRNKKMYTPVNPSFTI